MKQKLFIVFPLTLILLFIFSFIGIKSLFHSGFYTSHDGEHQVVRLYHFDKALKDGQIPPRWAETADNGYGYPLLNFTYQLPWFIGEPLLKIGFSLTDSVKGIFIIGYLLSGLFMFLWLKEKTGVLGGFLGAFLYLWAPYRFSNIFVRASLGEATVFMFLPLLFWGIEKIAEEKNKIFGIILTAIGIAGIILSHLMALIIIALPLMLWIIINILNTSYRHSGEGQNLYNNTLINIKSLRNIFLGIFLGILLSSYYLIPAIIEKNFTLANSILTSHYKDHFVSFCQLIYSKWDYGFDFPGVVNDAMSFQIGIAQWLIIGINILLFIYLFILKRKSVKYNQQSVISNWVIVIYSLLVFTFSIFMMLPVSAFIWEIIVKYSYFDFPWRFLGLTVFISAVAGAYLFSFINKLKIPLLVLIIIIALYTNRNHLRVNQYIYNSDKFYQENIGTSNQYDEYRSKILNGEYIKTKRSRFDANNSIKIEKIISKSNYYMAKGIAINNAEIIINIAYYPGWTVYVNKIEQKDIINKNGVLKTKILKGNFILEAKFKETPLRLLSDILTLSGLLFIVFLIIKILKK